MKRAMISQPMAGQTGEEIIAAREQAMKVIAEKGYKFVNTLFSGEQYTAEYMKVNAIVQPPLYFLAHALEEMSKCRAVYFCKGWENARGCHIEHEAAAAYGLTIIYEGETE